MSMKDTLKATASAIAMAVLGGGMVEQAHAEGVYTVECRDADGNLRWSDVAHNTVMTAGKNKMLDNYLAGSSFTQVGPFMGLISSASYSAISAADTMASHAGWLEAGGSNAPTYSGNRKTCVWSSASAGSKSLSAGLSFSITGTGTIKGVFIVLDTSAVNTKDDTNGTLWSAGLFAGGDRAVLSGDTVTASYSASL